MSLDFCLRLGPEICPTCGREAEEVYSRNITHNLDTMADKAGIYQALWEPQALGYTKAEQLIYPLKVGLERLRADPDYYNQFNAKNGWGMYHHFVPFVAEVLRACEQWPDAHVSVSV